MALFPGVRRRPASLRRRFAAGAIDVAVLAGAFVLGIGGIIAIGRGRDWPPDGDRLQDLGTNPRVARRIRFVSYGATLFLLTRPRWRSPGYRLLGLHRVDANTGESPGLRRRLAEAALDDAVRRGIARLNRPRRQRAEARRVEVDARRAEIRTRFAGDPEARARAENELSRDSAESCWAALIPPLAMTSVVSLTALASPRRQTVIERLAGIVVVRG